MPNWYGPAMGIFTKISEIAFSILREEGSLSVVYGMAHICKVTIMRIASLMFWTLLDLLDSQSIRTNPNLLEHKGFKWTLSKLLLL